MSTSDDEKCVGCDETLCKTCNSKRLAEEKWESENKVIDQFIRQIQLEAPSPDKLIEWIPFDDITKIKFLAKGGFGCVYKAEWKLGPIEYYDNITQNWHRSGNKEVVLKCIKSLKKNSITDDFFKEIKAQITSFEDFSYIIRCFGITKCKTSDNYIMVMEYKEDGSLHDYLYKNFKLLRWGQKLEILYTAIRGLAKIHQKELMHKDFHSGNIIISDNSSYIADFGLCKNVSSKDEKKNENEICGVLPYIAPEVLRGEPYTKASDIYSFGVVMNQVTVGYKPYYNEPHTKELAFKIKYDKIRPDINEDITPKIIVNLIKRCWSENPSDRPTAINLVDELQRCRQDDHIIWTEIESIEKKMNFDIPQEDPCLDYTTLENYASKTINVSNEPVSFSKSIEVPSVPEC